MEACERFPLIDVILDGWRGPLGADFDAYWNHCQRVANFCLAFAGDDLDLREKLAVAAAFHDLGIWSDDTYDYLEPSRRLARAYLADSGRSDWAEEIETTIELHHGLRPFRGDATWLVEPFRRADWTDVSMGWLRSGLSRAFVARVLATFPNAGFHRRLVALTLHRLRTHPLSPLPMLRL
jgi:hypothetical protein